MDQQDQPVTYQKQFGDYAVESGFCSRKDVDRALAIQRDLEERGFPHMLIGLVMVRYAIIDNGELIHILKIMQRDRATVAIDSDG